ncbi:MAG: AAA family ATPase [Oscillospiraceae bacterium]|nr:AAA family ATPase [Oscillospiraceae bacterium]
MNNKLKLSQEQATFVRLARQGRNILVDACIGSGKTTAIQHLCDVLPEAMGILYLTYNKLLKLDARAKIQNKNVTVTNYHGLAYSYLGSGVGISDLIQAFNRKKPQLNHYDVLIIDEYQDIEQELAYMLEYVRSTNPAMQIIAVGDMEQKIYDKTTLHAAEFIEHFLGKHTKLEFTQSFRMPADHAAMLGRIWEKRIVGVNPACTVEVMSKSEVTALLAKSNPPDILCLGARTGAMADTLNILESEHREKFNKKTVYASISDRNSGSSKPDQTSAIFTTFDSSKGLERKICVIFDFEESYWKNRISKPGQRYEILRNIFCVAASRGKERIIFAQGNQDLISEETLSTKVVPNRNFGKFGIADMFDFKYREDVEACYPFLEVKQMDTGADTSEIEIKQADHLIDLSPCIGIYQEAVFFAGYDIDRAIAFKIELNRDLKFLWTSEVKEASLDEKILFLTSLETRQNRYRDQVETPFVDEAGRQQIIGRLGQWFTPDEHTQVPCRIDFGKSWLGRFQKKPVAFSALGLADVVKGGVVYELKFVSEVTHEHFLQCACYMIALGLDRGVLWNVRNNTKYEVRVLDQKKFLNAVTKAITKGVMKKYHGPKK